MTELSPAAQAVMDAANNVRINSDWWPEGIEEIAAAVLRAAVAQTQRHPGHDIWQCDAEDLLAIAAELEGAGTYTSGIFCVFYGNTWNG